MLDLKTSYLQIAFNRSLAEVREMVSFLPCSSRILVEAGTPFVKRYGLDNFFFSIGVPNLSYKFLSI